MDFRTHTTQVADDLREEQLNGRSHLVAPVVLIKEGVLNAALVTNDEIARSEPGWNGVPFVVHHPEENGQYVSANQPHVLNETGIGGIYNVEFADNGDFDGLRGEAWLDVQRAVELGGDAEAAAEVLAAHYLAQEGEIDANDAEGLEMLEVSTGYFYDPVDETGKFGGNEYEERQQDILPDHLAALPGGKGACSVEDGCGAPRVNKFMSNRTNSGDGDGFIRNAARRVGIPLGGNGDGADADGEASESNDDDGDDCSCAHNSANDGNQSPATNNDTPNMSHNYEMLAENSDLSESALRELHDNDEDAFHALESAIEANADDDDGSDGGDDDTPEGGDGSDDGSDDGGDDGNAANSAVLEEIQSLREEVNTLREDKAESKREEAANTLESKGYDPEQYEDMDADALATFAEDAAPKPGAEFGGNAGAGANFLGRGAGGVSANDADDDEEFYDVGALTAAEDD